MVSLDRVLQRVTASALGLMNCRYAAVGVLAPDGQVLERFETAGLTPEEEAAIGPRTAKDARRAGLGVSVIAKEQTVAGLIAAVAQFPLPHAIDEFAPPTGSFPRIQG